MKTVTTLKALGYAEVTDAYEASEAEMLERAVASMHGIDFQVGLDHLNRKVIMRRKGEINLVKVSVVNCYVK